MVMYRVEPLFSFLGMDEVYVGLAFYIHAIHLFPNPNLPKISQLTSRPSAYLVKGVPRDALQYAGIHSTIDGQLGEIFLETSKISA